MGSHGEVEIDGQGAFESGIACSSEGRVAEMVWMMYEPRDVRKVGKYAFSGFVFSDLPSYLLVGCRAHFKLFQQMNLLESS